MTRRRMILLLISWKVWRVTYPRKTEDQDIGGSADPEDEVQQAHHNITGNRVAKFGQVQQELPEPQCNLLCGNRVWVGVLRNEGVRTIQQQEQQRVLSRQVRWRCQVNVAYQEEVIAVLEVWLIKGWRSVLGPARCCLARARLCRPRRRIASVLIGTRICTCAGPIARPPGASGTPRL
jgi:hypothetical protein